MNYGFEHCCSYDTIQTVLRGKNRIEQSFFNITDNILDRPLKNMVFDNNRIDDELIVSKPDCLNYYKLNRRPDSVKSSPIESTNSSSEFGSTEHRASCHRCGNMRKTILRCGICPYVYCTRCSEKMREEHGFDIFDNGCPVCKGVCCCGMNKTTDCNRMYHCYKKCPTTRSPQKRNCGHTHSSRSFRRCTSAKIEKSEEEEEELLDLSSCNEIPNNFTHTKQAATCPSPWSSAYNSAPEESNGARNSTTNKRPHSYQEPRPENHVMNYESVDKTKLKNILDDAMQSFSSILSPTSLMPEVNPFFLQCPLGSIGNIGHKVGKLPSIESLPYAKQGFYKDHNGILFPVNKPLDYYLPAFHNKEYSNPEDTFGVPLNEHPKNGDRAEEYSKVVSKNDELIERLLQQENRIHNGTRAAHKPSTAINNHSPPSTISSVDPVQFCREWLQHHGDAKVAHTPRTPSSNPSATSQLGKQFHFSLHKNGDRNKPSPEQKDPSSPIPFDSLFCDIPTNIPGTKYSQGDSIAAYMNLGIMTPGLTPMILSHITANENTYLENHGLMQEHLDDFLPEDMFTCHTPATARDTSDGLRASDPFHFTPFLTSSSVDTSHDQQGRDDHEGSFSMSNIDCTPILNLNCDQLRGDGSTSTLKKSNLEAHHDTLSTQPLNTTHATDSSQFSFRGNPESLALVCTELYTKILSDEIDCDVQEPRQANVSTRAAISEAGSEKNLQGRKQEDRNNKRKRIGQAEEEKKDDERGPLESFDDRIFEKDEPEYESTLIQYQ